jgi:WD40 repeat protein
MDAITHLDVVLRLTQRYIGHSNTIFAVVFDEGNQNPITTGKDGAIIVWGKDAKVPPLPFPSYN